MLGFRKKKKKDAIAADAKEATVASQTHSGGGDTTEKAPPPKKKKFITKRRIFILLLVLGSIGVSSFLVYKMYFTEKRSETAIYRQAEIPHVKLPEEMRKFSFDHFPDLYIALVNFNTEITLFEREIDRIEAIAQKYPEQKKITDTEKKVLEKGKNTLLKAFLKLEKTIKETYVLFQVNETQGLARIKEKKKDLTSNAQTALKTAREQTRKIKSHSPQVPEGILQGTLYKLKKKFL